VAVSFIAFASLLRAAHTRGFLFLGAPGAFPGENTFQLKKS